MTNKSLINKEDPFSLTKKMDSLSGLETFEGQIEIAAGDVAESTVRLAYHVHMVLEYDLWRHRLLDDKKSPAFGSQQEYLEYLAGNMNAGVSTLKAYHTAMRVAKSLGYSIDDIIKKGMSIFTEAARRLVLDRQTGEPKALKSGEIPEGYNITGYVREVIDDVGPSDSKEMRIRGGDIRRELDAKLLKGKPQIEFDIPDPSKPQYVTWHVELWEDDMLVEIKGNHGPISNSMPDYVKEAWFKLLRVSWKLEG